MTEGQSIRKSAQACHVHRNTTFRWRHRFLALPDQQKVAKRGGKASKRGLSDEKIPVLMGRGRTGNTPDFVLEKADKAHLCAALKPVLSSDSILCTDSGKARVAAARERGIAHHRINLAAGIRGVFKVYHVQNINAYDRRLKTWIRRFHGVATHYLPRYIGGCRLIDRSQNAWSPAASLSASIGINYLQRLTVT